MDKKNILLLGDTHGSFDILGRYIKNFVRDSYIIQVGDFCIMNNEEDNHSYEHGQLNYLNKCLQETNSELLIIRGNHDNPFRFKELKHPYSFENITLIPDYTELNLLGKNILLIGGAVSVDRLRNKLGVDYWKEEVFEFRSDFNYGQYDLVVTHSKPFVCDFKNDFENIKFYLSKDKALYDDLIKEKDLFDQLYYKTKPSHFCFGHYHESYSGKFENTNFRCLDIMEFYLYHSIEQPFS